MSTAQISEETEAQYGNKLIYIGRRLARSLAVAGGVSVVLTHSFMLALLMDLVVGNTLPATAEFVLASAIGVPVVVSLVVLAAHIVELVTREPQPWRSLIINATAAACIASPALVWLV